MSLPIILQMFLDVMILLKINILDFFVKPRSSRELKKAIKIFLENPLLAIKYEQQEKNTSEFTDKIIIIR